VPGTPDPVKDASEVTAFAQEHGLPVAIKAAFGGGGRGLKVARTLEEIPELYESAVREAIAAFGRGECFVERYLDSPRHVETQVLADQAGNVVVVSTRDCSLQRRHQKLVEEAPAPFLTEKQREALYSSSKAIIKEAGYYNAGTCEFLIGTDGTISFLEVNTRLQVEHPVSEEVAGIDLVREQFRIARGGTIDYPDPELRGHSIEFRINGEDPGRGFLPGPGKLALWQLPSGPGVRVDTGFEAGDVIGGNFDSLLAKLIVTGKDRQEALQRSRRALAEFNVDGIATALTFHRVVVNDPAFAPADEHTPFTVHTRWIETEFNNEIPAYSGDSHEPDENSARKSVVVEVNGKRLEVTLPQGFGAESSEPTPTAKKRERKKASANVSGDALTAPMQGTIVKIDVAEGQEVSAGDLIVVLEAMKMEQPLTAHKSGKITALNAQVGTTVPAGTLLCEITSSQ
jgi:acetyl-CoA/propionyl-CoA carboxylase biotin carboxyl carrier protein